MVNDWNMTLIGDVFEFKNGLNKGKEFFGFGTPIINYTDVYKNRSLNKSDIKGKVSLDTDEIKRFEAKQYDVFFTRTSETPDEVGMSSVLLEDIECCVFSGFVLRARPKNQTLLPRYCKYCFSTPDIRSKIILGCTYTTRALTNGKQLSAISIPVPPISEQERIAETLSDVDDLISSLEKLIAKKKAVKQGAMQELLTGKKRLPCFDWDWVDCRIGAMGEFYNGLSGKSKNDFDRGDAHFITFLNVLSNIKIDTSILASVDVKENESQNAVQKGDLFFNTSSETPEEVGMCAVLDEELENTYLNSFCFGFRLNDDTHNPLFLSYYLNSSIGRKIMSVLAQGATRYNLSKNNFVETVIRLPSKEEQTAIASILSDMDNEIDALEQKLVKTRQIKQGMMQQLLTGKIRLV